MQRLEENGPTTENNSKVDVLIKFNENFKYVEFVKNCPIEQFAEEGKD